MRAGAIAAALTGTRSARAEQAPEDGGDRTVVVGVGGAGEVELGGGSFHAGANAMVEWEAIEGWLELEASISVLSAEGGPTVPADLLFKKPFRVSRAVEIMAGLGPEIVRVTGRGSGTFFGVEGALDFMFWPARHVGFWVEPSYDATFQDGVSRGAGCNAGVLFGW